MYNLQKIAKLNRVISQGYQIHHDDKWLYCHYHSAELPTQGWKIHISCSPDDFQKMLDMTIPILLSEKLCFKVPVKHHDMLNLAYGKAGLLETGKMMTIYPSEQREVHLHHICQRLSNSLKLTHYPFIQTDIQYANSPVFLRYGAFFSNSILLDEFGNNTSAIYNNSGNLIRDNRKIGYYKPAWISLPEFLRKSLPIMRNSSVLLEQHHIKIQHLLSSTIKSMVFSILYHDKPAILKVGRAEPLIDNDSRTGKDRTKHEFEMLRKVSSYLSSPKPYETFEDERGFYLVEDEIFGYSLINLHSQESFLSGNKVKVIKIIINDLVNDLDKLHQHGIVFRDLSPHNVRIDKQGHAHLIDFELSDHQGALKPISGNTPGYFNAQLFHRTNRRVDYTDDNYALGSLIFFICTSYEPAFNESLHTTDGSVLLVKLRKIVDSLDLHPDMRHLASLGIALITEPDVSLTQLRSALNTGTTSEKNKDRATLSAPKIFALTEEYCNQVLLPDFKKLISTAEYSEFVDNQWLKEAFVLSRYLEYSEDCEKNKSVAHLIFRGISLQNGRNSAATLANGSILDVYVISKLLLQKNCFTDTEEITLSRYLINRLENIYNLDYTSLPSGILYGVAGIGVALLLSLPLINDPTAKRIATSIVTRIKLNLIKRRYLIDKHIAWDVGEFREGEGPKNQLCNDFGTGISGIGLFFAKYFERFHDNESKENVILIGQFLKNSVQYLNGDFGWTQTKQSESFYQGLCSGSAGICLFLHKYLELDDDCQALNIVQTVEKKLLRNNCGVFFWDLENGLAGIIMYFRLIKTVDFAALAPLVRSLLSLGSSNNGTWLFSTRSTFDLNPTGFLDGSMGIHFSLLASLDLLKGKSSI